MIIVTNICIGSNAYILGGNIKQNSLAVSRNRKIFSFNTLRTNSIPLSDQSGTSGSENGEVKTQFGKHKTYLGKIQSQFGKILLYIST